MRKKQNVQEEPDDIYSIPAIADRAVSQPECVIPEAVVKRLPRYFRCLRGLLNNDVMKISSSELSDLTGVNAAQLRQDLKYFGGLGQRGYGYNVKKLYTSISEQLGVTKKYTAVLIGAGNLGRAIINSRLCEQRGVWIKAVFDGSPSVIGKEIGDRKVSDVAELRRFCRENKTDIAVLCIPADAKSELLGIIKDCGFKGVWNFSPCELDDSDAGAKVENICTGDSLSALLYRMCEDEREKE